MGPHYTELGITDIRTPVPSLVISRQNRESRGPSPFNEQHLDGRRLQMTPTILGKETRKQACCPCDREGG